MLAREVLAMVAALEGAKAYYFQFDMTTTVAPVCTQTEVCGTNPTISGTEIVPEGTVHCGDTVTGDTTGSTSPAGVFCGTSAGQVVHWYKFEETCMTPLNSVTFSLCASSFDTKIQVYEPESCDGGDVGCSGGNDDVCGTQSEVTLPGSTNLYYVAIQGFGMETGAYSMTVTCT